MYHILTQRADASELDLAPWRARLVRACDCERHALAHGSWDANRKSLIEARWCTRNERGYNAASCDLRGRPRRTSGEVRDAQVFQQKPHRVSQLSASGLCAGARAVSAAPYAPGPPLRAELGAELRITNRKTVYCREKPYTPSPTTSYMYPLPSSAISIVIQRWLIIG